MPYRRSATSRYLSNLLQLLAFAALALLVVWLLVRGAENLGYSWQWYRVPRYLGQFGPDGFQPGPLLRGLGLTLLISACSLLLALLFGLATALLRLSGSITGRLLATGYLESVRNTPLLVQIFLVYFVLAPILGIERFAAAVLALSLFEGAYIAEIIRAGIVTIPRGQWEAAAALGMSRRRCLVHIVLPQALRHTAPPLTSQAVSLIKDSALVSTIAVFDLTMMGQQIVAETFLTFEIWFTVAAIYLTMTLGLAGLVRHLERRLNGHGPQFLDGRF